MPDAAVAAHLDGLLDAHAGLVASIECVDGAALSEPSLLPGWTRAHVLAHLAANADSFVRIIEAAAHGRTVDQYEGGATGRVAGIETGARRPAGDLVGWVRSSASDLESALRAAPESAWHGEGTSVSGARIPVSEIPVRRRREVEVHRADLGLGYGWSEWPAAWVRDELPRQEMRVLSRTPMGLARLPAPVLALAPHERLAWMFGRRQVGGVPAPEPF